MSIISVHNLGKCYHLGHTAGPNTLRDRLAQGFNGLFSRRARKPSEEFWALRDVSFEVQEGEVLGIIGRNGAGKSTLLKILSQITEPTTGEVRVRGRVASLLEVGTGFHGELSGRENIFLNGAILGMTKAEIRRKFDEIVAFSGVEKFLDTPVKRYSSGMTVRLAFSVAAHLEPEILLIDEVLAVGDVEFQKKCLGKMDDVAKSGRTILFVSHNMAAVSNLCTHGVLLNQGVVEYSDGIESVVRKYMDLNKISGDLTGKSFTKYGDIFKILSLVDETIELNEIQIGEGFVFYASFRTPEPTARPRMGLVLKRAVTGEPVFSFNSEISGASIFSTTGNGFEFQITFDTMNLINGEYYADVYLGNEAGNFEVVNNAISFSVIEKDVFGTGKLPSSKWGPMLVIPKYKAKIIDI